MITDREKIINAIEKAKKQSEEYAQDHIIVPFKEADMILALLKGQEARVMTLDEVKAFDWDYCYLEEERLPGKEYRIICGNYALSCITWPCVASMRIQHGDNNYGKKWRCWTFRPTDEQRKEVKWDGNNGDHHGAEDMGRRA